MTEIKKKRNYSAYSLFFDENHNQRKGFVIFSVLLPLIITVIFSIWGTVIAKQSYELSLNASRNHDQIDTMQVMLKELKTQNKLLMEQNRMTSMQVVELAVILATGENLSEIQKKHLQMLTGNINDSKIPKLAIEDTDYELGSDEVSEFADINRVELVNYGGEIKGLRYQKIDSLDFNKNNIPSSNLPTNSNMVFEFKRTFLDPKKSTLRARLLFEDALNNKYYQDLILIKNNDFKISFQLGKMTPRK